LAALVFAEVHVTRRSGGVPRCFVVEVLRDLQVRPGFGRWGAALFGELARELERAGVNEIDLITRFQHGSSGQQGRVKWAAGDEFESTAGARALFEELGFHTVWEHRVGEQQPDDSVRPANVLFGVYAGQRYMTARTCDVLAAASGFHLKAGATIRAVRKACKATEGTWWERKACALLRAHHDAIAEHAIDLDDLLPNPKLGVFSIYGYAPLCTAGEHATPHAQQQQQQQAARAQQQQQQAARAQQQQAPLQRKYSTEAARYNIALLHTATHLVNNFEDVRAATDADETTLTRARARVLDEVVTMITPTSSKRDEHEAAGGSSWKLSAVLNSEAELARVYSAIEVHARMRNGGELAGLNLDSYLRRRERAKQQRDVETLSAKDIVTLLADATKKAQPKVQPVEVVQGPSAAKRRRDQLSSALAKHARPSGARVREIGQERERLQARLAALAREEADLA
jgi:type II secretory pathway pseudopilin PulG